MNASTVKAAGRKVPGAVIFDLPSKKTEARLFAFTTAPLFPCEIWRVGEGITSELKTGDPEAHVARMTARLAVLTREVTAQGKFPASSKLQ